MKGKSHEIIYNLYSGGIYPRGTTFLKPYWGIDHSPTPDNR